VADPRAVTSILRCRWIYPKHLDRLGDQVYVKSALQRGEDSRAAASGHLEVSSGRIRRRDGVLTFREQRRRFDMQHAARLFGSSNGCDRAEDYEERAWVRRSSSRIVSHGTVGVLADAKPDGGATSFH